MVMVVVLVWRREERDSSVVVAVAAVCRPAASVNEFTAITANAGSAGNSLFPLDPVFARKLRMRMIGPANVPETTTTATAPIPFALAVLASLINDP